MKKIIIAFSLAIGLAFSAQADDHEEKKHANFDEHKKMMLENIDKRMANLQEHKSCVSAATEKEAMKKCHEAMKESHGDMKEHRQEMKKERKAKREEMKKERKAKRKEKRGKKDEAPATTEAPDDE